MRRNFRAIAGGFSALALAVFCLCAVAQAQTGRDARLVSAQAGGVNYVSGDVTGKLKGEADWRALTTEQTLETGDSVKTGMGGRVEVLLSPGSYLRVGGNSEFVMSDTSLDTLRVRLVKGSAIVEANGYDDLPLGIAFDTPQTRITIIKKGIYRFSVTAAGTTEVAVHKGRAMIGSTLLKGGQVASIGGGSGLEIAKLDKKNADALDEWSKQRGKELAQANRQFTRRTLTDLFVGNNFDPYGFYNPLASPVPRGGIWVFHPGARCFTFIPFYGGWSSPYGFSYGSQFYGFGYHGTGVNTTCLTCAGSHTRGGTGIAGHTPQPNQTGGATQTTHSNPVVVSPPPTRTIEAPIVREAPRPAVIERTPSAAPMPARRDQ
ncbi:MAG TPA: FecR family protein [Pyrinomonadaceae bacterium]|nr:FecR family protein [Pyrinomonadaceae bacterium]